MPTKTATPAPSKPAKRGPGRPRADLGTADAGAIDLDNSVANGTLVGYRFTGAATVEGIELPAGSYVFERNTLSASGWTYREIASASDLPLPDDPGEEPGEDVETTPQQPTWNDSLREYVIANTTGVQYKKGGVNIAAGTYSTTSPTAAETVTITAVPKTGYVFPGGVATSWSHDYPLVSSWTTAFSDTLLTPTGQVTERTGWTVTNAASGADDIAIDASGIWLTGNSSLVRANDPALKHDVTIEYDLSAASTGFDRIIVDVARGYQPHRHILRREDSGSVRMETWYPNTLNGDSVYLMGLPLTGTLRAESDGLYVFAYINGTKVSEGPHVPGYVIYPPTDSGVTLKGEPVNGTKTRAKNLVVRTKA